MLNILFQHRPTICAMHNLNLCLTNTYTHTYGETYLETRTHLIQMHTHERHMCTCTDIHSHSYTHTRTHTQQQTHSCIVPRKCITIHRAYSIPAVANTLVTHIVIGQITQETQSHRENTPSVLLSHTVTYWVYYRCAF